MDQNPASISSLSDDVTSKILFRLPANSIGRLRCVSKRFLSLTTNPQFIKTHSSISPCGFFLRNFNNQTELFHFNGGETSSSSSEPALSFLYFKGFGVEIIHSCNGLILCCLPHYLLNRKKNHLLSVCNPTTREHCVVPAPKKIQDFQFNLAFDPSVSPHFKVFALKRCTQNRKHSICVFSSHTWLWKLIDDVNVSACHRSISVCHRSVFWKRTLCWFSYRCILCLDVMAEQFRHLPLPVPMTEVIRVGESGGRLHCISSSFKYAYSCNYDSHYDIFEMESKSSGWSWLYRINHHDIERGRFPARVIWFLRGEGDEVGDRLLLRGFSKTALYHIKDKAISTVCSHSCDYSQAAAYPHANTLFSLNGLPTHPDWVCWKSGHDNLLLSLMVEDSLDGRKLGFKWDVVVEKFNRATKLNYKIRQLKNRFKSYKQESRIVSSVLGCLGFDWNPEQQMASACEADWRRYLKVLYDRKQGPLEIICATSMASYQEVSSKIMDAEVSEGENLGRDNKKGEGRNGANEIQGFDANVMIASVGHDEISPDDRQTLHLKRKGEAHVAFQPEGIARCSKQKTVEDGMLPE